MKTHHVDWTEFLTVFLPVSRKIAHAIPNAYTYVTAPEMPSYRKVILNEDVLLQKAAELYDIVEKLAYKDALTKAALIDDPDLETYQIAERFTFSKSDRVAIYWKVIDFFVAKLKESTKVHDAAIPAMPATKMMPQRKSG